MLTCHGISLIAAIALCCSVATAQEGSTALPPLVIAKQGSFFVAGRDIHPDNLSSTTTRAPSGTITVDQVYVKVSDSRSRQRTSDHADPTVVA